MESDTLILVLVGILLIAAVSKRVRGTVITLPMLYTLFGLAVAVFLRYRHLVPEGLENVFSLSLALLVFQAGWSRLLGVAVPDGEGAA